MEKFLRKLNSLYKVEGSWRKVAKRLGVNERTLRRYWDGTRNPSPAVQSRL